MVRWWSKGILREVFLLFRGTRQEASHDDPLDAYPDQDRDVPTASSLGHRHSPSATPSVDATLRFVTRLARLALGVCDAEAQVAVKKRCWGQTTGQTS